MAFKNAREHIRRVSAERADPPHVAGLLLQLHGMVNATAVIDSDGEGALAVVLDSWPLSDKLLQALTPMIVAAYINGVRTN